MGALDHLNLVISDFKLFLQLVFFKSLITVTLAVLHVQTLNQVKCLCGIVSDYIYMTTMNPAFLALGLWIISHRLMKF